MIPGMLFENMGILYLGPVDGHNIPAMVKLFKEASKVEGPVLVHVITEKGKGYLPAERHPTRFHGTEAFDVETGLPLVKRVKANYTDIFLRLCVNWATGMKSGCHYSGNGRWNRTKKIPEYVPGTFL